MKLNVPKELGFVHFYQIQVPVEQHKSSPLNASAGVSCAAACNIQRKKEK